MTNYYGLDEEIKKRKKELDVLVKKQEEIRLMEANGVLEKKLDKVSKLELANELKNLLHNYMYYVNVYDYNRVQAQTDKVNSAINLVEELYGIQYDD